MRIHSMVLSKKWRNNLSSYKLPEKFTHSRRVLQVNSHPFWIFLLHFILNFNWKYWKYRKSWVAITTPYYESQAMTDSRFLFQSGLWMLSVYLQWFSHVPDVVLLVFISSFNLVFTIANYKENSHWCTIALHRTCSHSIDLWINNT